MFVYPFTFISQPMSKKKIQTQAYTNDIIAVGWNVLCYSGYCEYYFDKQVEQQELQDTFTYNNRERDRIWYIYFSSHAISLVLTEFVQYQPDIIQYGCVAGQYYTNNAHY